MQNYLKQSERKVKKNSHNLTKFHDLIIDMVTQFERAHELDMRAKKPSRNSSGRENKSRNVNEGGSKSKGNKTNPKGDRSKAQPEYEKSHPEKGI